MSEATEKTFNLKARDDRFFRAAESVLKQYTIARRPQLENGFAIFDVTGGTSAYVVKVHPEWRCAPQCNCPDAENRAKTNVRGYCKHVIGVLLENDEFRCQLLEAFL